MASKLEGWRRAAYNAEECLAGCLASPEIAKHLDQATARTILERLSQARIEMLEASEAIQRAGGEPVDDYDATVNDIISMLKGTDDEIAFARRLAHAGYRRPYLFAPPAAAHGHVPSVSGIGRDAGHPRALVLYLRSEPTDDDIRAIQEALRGNAAAHGDEYEIWSAAQLAPGEGIEDGAERIRALICKPAAHGDEVVRKDAERYRWLRACGDEWGTLCFLDSRGDVDAEALDEAIDAAMRAQGDGETEA